MRKKIISVVAIVMTALLFCACLSKNDDTTNDEKVETISITTTPPCTTGTVKIYSNRNGVIFEGYGEIKIKNSGWNGRPIEIEIFIDENDEIGE